MQFSPLELKEKLLRALDEDNNVVDMLGVLEIISILENYPITREALEQTRIGKHVNELRKKTSCRDLAKRAKNLVKRWQQLVSPAAQTNTVNGDGIAGRLGVAPPSGIPHHLQNAGIKPASPGSRPGTPSSVKSNQSPASIPNSGTATPGSRPGTPSGGNGQTKVSPKLSMARPLGHGAKPASPALDSGNGGGHAGKRVSPPVSHAPNKNSVVHRSSTPTEGLGKTHVANKRKRRAEDSNSAQGKKVARREENHEGAQNHTPSKPTPRMNGMTPGAPNHETSQKGLHVSNTHDSSKIPPPKRVSPSPNECDDSSTRPGLLARRNVTLPASTEICDNSRASLDATPVSATSDRSDKSKLDRTPSGTSLSQTPKVKTTAQLIKELYASGDLRLTASETVTKIALNQIEKEEDLSQVSIVPPEAKPRPRRKPGSAHAPPGTPNESLTKTKTEMVQKFLQSSITPSSSELELANLGVKEEETLLRKDNTDAFLTSLETSLPSPQFNAGSEKNDEHDGAIQFGGNVLGNEDTVNGGRSENIDISDRWSALPPLDLNSVNLADDEYEVPVIPEPDESTVDRLHNDNWSGVNGQFDSTDTWHDWTKTYSMPSFNSEPLHLLPYVNIDD